MIFKLFNIFPKMNQEEHCKRSSVENKTKQNKKICDGKGGMNQRIY